VAHVSACCWGEGHQVKHFCPSLRWSSCWTRCHIADCPGILGSELAVIVSMPGQQLGCRSGSVAAQPPVTLTERTLWAWNSILHEFFSVLERSSHEVSWFLPIEANRSPTAKSTSPQHLMSQNAAGVRGTKQSTFAHHSHSLPGPDVLSQTARTSWGPSLL